LRALISVSDKTGIIDFAKGLVELGFEIISTGGTYKLLKQNSIEAIEIDKVTKFPECFEGRVKTLNPYIHGGILYKRDKSSHTSQAKELGIEAIDLVCVNLYPFKETINKTDDFEEIIENIDIGGPTMVRSAAKNFESVLIVTDINDYDKVIDAIKNKKDNFDFRKDLMIKAYSHTASYDAMIANYMNKRFNNSFGNYQFIVGKKVFNTRYGENPHQRGALYQFEDFYDNNFTIIKGEPSFNNMLDISNAINIATAFGDENVVVIVKHGNPCGVAIKNSLLESYNEALKCDPISAFGGVVAVNGIVDLALAKKMNEMFLEVIIAAGFSDEAIEEFSKKKRLKLFSQNRQKLINANDKYNFKMLNGGFVYQDSDKIDTNEIKNAKVVSKKAPSKQELKDLEIALKIAIFTKSNCVVYVKDSAMVAIGMGMTSRVDAAIAAINKAKVLNLDLSGCVLASEAFFPFRDSIDEAAKVGVSAVIEPGGSVRDEEVIKAANEHGMSLLFSGIRHFNH